MRFFSLLLALLSMSILSADEPFDLRIPLVDMQDFYKPEKRDAFIDTLYHAMREVGFFAVRNTGVNREMLQRAYKQSEQFFKQEMNYKEKSFVKELDGQRGFVPGESAKGNRAKDCKQFYHIGRELAATEYQRFNIPPNFFTYQPPF